MPAIELLTEALDFRVSDWVRGGAFVRCNADHHGLAVLPGDCKMQHQAWEVESIADLGRLGDLLHSAGGHLSRARSATASAATSPPTSSAPAARRSSTTPTCEQIDRRRGPCARPLEASDTSGYSKLGAAARARRAASRRRPVDPEVRPASRPRSRRRSEAIVPAADGGSDNGPTGISAIHHHQMPKSSDQAKQNGANRSRPQIAIAHRRTPKRAEIIAHQLVDYIVDSDLAPGTSLPPEHEMIELGRRRADHRPRGAAAARNARRADDQGRPRRRAGRPSPPSGRPRRGADPDPAVRARPGLRALRGARSGSRPPSPGWPAPGSNPPRPNSCARSTR